MPCPYYVPVLAATYGEDQDAKIQDVPLEIEADNVKSYAFPTYTATDFKDDMVGSQPHSGQGLGVMS